MKGGTDPQPVIGAYMRCSIADGTVMYQTTGLINNEQVIHPDDATNMREDTSQPDWRIIC